MAGTVAVDASLLTKYMPFEVKGNGITLKMVSEYGGAHLKFLGPLTKGTPRKLELYDSGGNLNPAAEAMIKSVLGLNGDCELQLTAREQTMLDVLKGNIGAVEQMLQNPLLDAYRVAIGYNGNGKYDPVETADPLQDNSVLTQVPETGYKTETTVQPPASLGKCPEKVLEKIQELQKRMDVYSLPYVTSTITGEQTASEKNIDTVRDAVKKLREKGFLEKIEVPRGHIYTVTPEGQQYLIEKYARKKQTTEHPPIIEEPAKPIEAPKRAKTPNMNPPEDSILQEIVADFKKLDPEMEEVRYSDVTSDEPEETNVFVERGNYYVRIKKPRKTEPLVAGTLMYTTKDAPGEFSGAVYLKLGEDIFCMGYVKDGKIMPSVESVYAEIAGTPNRKPLGSRKEYEVIQQLFEEQLEITPQISEIIAKDIAISQKYRNLKSIITNNKNLTPAGKSFLETANAVFVKETISIPVDGKSFETIELMPGKDTRIAIKAAVMAVFEGDRPASKKKTPNNKHHSHKIGQRVRKKEDLKRRRERKKGIRY